VTAEIVERVRRSRRYRHVDEALVARLAAEEIAKARSTEDAVKRVKRRLHQAVGAFRGTGAADPLAELRAAWSGDLRAPAVRDACAGLLRRHASTRERLPHLTGFYRGIWAVTGVPGSVLDLGCGMGPAALSWMGLAPEARYVATDVDTEVLETVEAVLELLGQPHEVGRRDLVTGVPSDAVDVALMLKLVPTLDRQDAAAATRIIAELATPWVAVSFPRRSLGGRATGMDRAYRERLDRLVADSPRVRTVTDASVPNELVFLLGLDG
jgi:16S rRNA (guanine(1405)-N(7))-methyltransferase